MPSKRLQALSGENQSVDVQPVSTTTAHFVYKIETYFTSLDHVVSEMKARFGEDESDKDQNLICALSSIVIHRNGSKKDFELICEHYNFDLDLLKADACIFYNLTREESTKNVPDLLLIIHSKQFNDMLPHFYKVVCILGTIPATSCTAERSFSQLRRVKSYLRSTMNQDRLAALSLLDIERRYTNMFVGDNIDCIIDQFSSAKPSRHVYFV